MAEEAGEADPLPAARQAAKTLDAAGVGFYFFDVVHDVIHWNEALHRIMGTDPESFGACEAAVEARIHPDDVARWRLRVRNLALADGDDDSQFRIVRPDGTIRWIEARSSWEEAVDGRRQVRGVVLDVTDRVQTELHLREVNRRFEEVQHVARVGSWEWAPASDAVVWSDTMFEIFGRDRAKGPLTAQTYADRVHPNDRQKAEAAVAQSLVDGEYEVEYRIIREDDGEERVLRCRGVTTYGADGSTVRQSGTAIDVTELRTAEAEASRSTRRLADLVQQAPISLQVYDRDGHMVEGNRSFGRLFGMDTDRMDALSAYSVLDAPQLAAAGVQDTPERALRGEVVDLPRMRYETGSTLANLGLRVDGAVAPWIEGRFFPLRNAEGAVDGIGAVILDVTAQVEAEQMRHQAEVRLRTVFDHAPLGTALFETDGTIVEANPAFCHLIGRDPAEIIDRSVNDFIHDEDVVLYSPDYVNLIEGRADSYVVDKRFVRPGGEIRWCSVTVAAVRGDGREARQVIASVEDVTERRAAEKKVRQAAEVFRSTAEVVMITDVDGVLLDVNEAFTRVTGYSREEAIGATPRLLQSGRHDDGFYCAMWATLREVGQWRGEIWNRRKSSEIYPALLTISVVPGTDGEAVGYVAVAADITSMKRSEERLDHLANHDPLTGLPNRRLVASRLDQSIGRAQRNRSGLALLFVDIDHFKSVNDGFSHSVGDELLRSVADRLARVVRDEDTVARMGGDEFLVLVEGAGGVAEATVVVEKLMSSLREPFGVRGGEIRATVSVGVSLYPDNGTETAVLLRNADAAMHRAKDAGRDTYEFYSPGMTDAAGEYVRMAGELRQALERGEFRLVYQPQFSLASGRIVGVESLVRWDHPVHGTLLPGRFIRVAEQSGLIRDLGTWILCEACRQGADWADRGVEFGRMAVNLASQQLRHGDLRSVVDLALESTGLSPNLLALEVTEGFMMERPDDSVELLTDLVGLGIEIAIDDFGTGYSSLSYLKRLPIQKLKIDRSFVDGLPDDGDDVAIVEAILAMGRSLGMVVIAEGVETEAQAAALIARGCHEGQGFHLARPMTPTEFEQRFG
ncbi:MAG: EAL domain-containing protein [Acidimicrobiales bacterium]